MYLRKVLVSLEILRVRNSLGVTNFLMFAITSLFDTTRDPSFPLTKGIVTVIDTFVTGFRNKPLDAHKSVTLSGEGRHSFSSPTVPKMKLFSWLAPFAAVLPVDVPWVPFILTSENWNENLPLIFQTQRIASSTQYLSRKLVLGSNNLTVNFDCICSISNNTDIQLGRNFF